MPDIGCTTTGSTLSSTRFGPSSAIVATLLTEIRACTVCAKALKAGPRPVVQFGPSSRIVIIGQAPGARVHESGVPWQDDSGTRLRDWTGLAEADFYDPAKIALVPMGFCYPGKGASGDLPPRPECAPLWHDKVLSALKATQLTLLVGSYAHARYLERKQTRRGGEGFAGHGAGFSCCCIRPGAVVSG